MKIVSILHRTSYFILFILCFGGFFSSAAAAADESTVPAILGEFDDADSKSQRLLAARFFDQLNSEQYFEEPYSLPAEWPADSVRAEVWLTAAQYFFNGQEYRDVVKYAEKALPLLRHGNDIYKITDCLSCLSSAYARTADYATAIKYGEELLAIDRAEGDKGAVSGDLSNLTFMYLSSGRPTEARNYILEAIENSTAVGDSLRMARQMGIASEVFQNLGENDKAIAYATKAYEIDMACGRESRAAIRLCQLAAAQMVDGKMTEARSNLLKALPMLEKSGNMQSYSIACNQLGRIALSNNNPVLAASYYNKALEFFRKSGDYYNESKARKGLSEALKNSNPQAAMAHLERLIVLKDSLYQREIREATSEFAAKYGNEKLQQSLEYERHQYRTVLWSTAIILLLATCAIALLIYLNKVRRQCYDILQREEKIRTDFFTNITHEFRTPLTVIHGASNHALKHLDDTDVIIDDLHAIVRHESRLLCLINQLLDIAKLSSGSAQKLPWHNGNVAGYITMLCESCHMYGAERNVSVEYASEPEFIQMDFVPEYMERIVQNLLSNALKFSHPGGVVSVHTSMKGNNLILTVHDNGIGIPASEQKNIFMAFHQVGGKNSSKGSGLGLPLASLSAKAMNGTITVESEPNSGTTFTVTLPLKSAESVEGSFDVKTYHLSQPEFENPDTLVDAVDTGADTESYDTRVLIVEDTQDVAKYIACQMNPSFNYYFAANGKEGLAKAEELMPDIIITDIMMPEMDGFEMTSEIRASELLNHIPVIMVTARATHEDRLKGFEVGADAYLEKPFHADELNIRAEKLLEQRRLLQHKFAAALEVLPEDAESDSTQPTEEPETLEVHLSRREQNDKAFVDKFVEIVHNLMAAGKLDYKAIASEMFIGRAQLNRKLKAITGITTKEYILNLRLLRAKELLLSTDLTVAEIAYQCGMDDPGYFSTIFRKATGMTPMAYRIENIKSHDKR